MALALSQETVLNLKLALLVFILSGSVDVDVFERQ
jgi:hypothetical protein